MKRNVSVVRLIVATRSSGPSASQPVSCLTRLSADLSVIWLRVPDYFVWEHLKGRIYQNKPRPIDALKANITEVIQAVTADVLARTFQNMARRAQSCLDANGGHFQHMIWCRRISYITNVLLFKFRCNIFIGVRIIKEMPGSVASGTPCIIFSMHLELLGRFPSRTVSTYLDIFILAAKKQNCSLGKQTWNTGTCKVASLILRIYLYLQAVYNALNKCVCVTHIGRSYSQWLTDGARWT